MAARNVTARNAPHRIDAISRTNVDVVDLLTGQIGSPKKLSGVWDRFYSLCFDVEWTIGAEITNAIAVTAQLMDLSGRNLGRYATVLISIHDSDSVGANVGAVATNIDSLTIGTGTQIVAHTAAHVVEVITDSDGKIVFTLTDATGADFDKAIITIGDRVFQSPLIEFAA